MARPRRLFSLLLKLLFSFAILVFILIKQTSFRDILAVLKTVNPLWLLIAFSLHTFGLFSSAIRWQILAKAQGDDIPLGYLAKSYLVGQFFNNFLPTNFGGDIVRIWDGSRYCKSVVKSSAIVVVERFTGISVLFLMAVVGSRSGSRWLRRFPSSGWPFSSALWASGRAPCSSCRSRGACSPPSPSADFPTSSGTRRCCSVETILFTRTQAKPFLRATLWALLLQVNVVLYYFLIGQGLHLHIHFVDYFIFIPLVLIIQTIPITISGLGLREES